jgi:hypothetical protein
VTVFFQVCNGCVKVWLEEVLPGFPIVFMTGYASEATMYGNGLRDEDIRLMKPVPRMGLLSAVSKVLFAR